MDAQWTQELDAFELSALRMSAMAAACAGRPRKVQHDLAYAAAVESAGRLAALLVGD